MLYLNVIFDIMTFSDFCSNIAAWFAVKDINMSVCMCMHTCVRASATLFLCCCVFTMLVPVDAVLWSLGIVCSLRAFWNIVCWTCCLLTCAYWMCSMCFSQSASPNHLRSQSDLSTPTTPPPYSSQSRVSLTWLLSPCLTGTFSFDLTVSVEFCL